MNRRPTFWLITGLLAAVLAACTAPTDEAKQSDESRSITAKELAEQIQQSQAPLILDVRSETEYASGHIPGSLNIPVDQLANRLSELGVPKTEEIVVHCHSGHRAQIAESVLVQAGYSNVRDLEGHMQGWRSDGYPIEKP